MWKAVEIAALALLLLCTALLLVIRASRFLVTFLIQILFAVAVVVGIVWYVLDEIGLL